MIFQKNPPGVTEILKKSTIGVAGCGGLGSNAAISLTRAGLGKLILCDKDYVEISNLNRQNYFRKDVGKRKIDALEEQLKNINHKIKIDKYFKKITKNNFKTIFSKAEILIEAFDKAAEKIWLINEWSQAYPEKEIIVGNGIGGYGGTEKIKVRKEGKIILCGNGKTEENKGLCSPRVSIVANFQANVAIEILVKKKMLF